LKKHESGTAYASYAPFNGVMANIAMSLLFNIEQTRTTVIAYIASDFQDQRDVV
jgi:hypothetical protein